MLEVRCPEHLEAVRGSAHSINLEDQLQAQLDFLSTYGHGGCSPEELPEESQQNLCVLQKDFAPHSFAFALFRPAAEKNGERPYWFNGGLIYQGPDSPADGGFPSLCVSLAPGTGWFVHT